MPINKKFELADGRKLTFDELWAAIKEEAHKDTMVLLHGGLKNMSKQAKRYHKVGIRYDFSKAPLSPKFVWIDQTWIVSGIYPMLGKRPAVKSILQEYGAKVTTQLSDSLTHLLIGQNPGNKKIQFCQARGIRIVTELELIQELGLEMIFKLAIANAST